MRTALFFLSSPPLHNFIYFSQICVPTAYDAVATLYMFPQMLAFMKQVNSGPPNPLDEGIQEPEGKRDFFATGYSEIQLRGLRESSVLYILERCQLQRIGNDTAEIHKFTQVRKTTLVY